MPITNQKPLEELNSLPTTTCVPSSTPPVLPSAPVTTLPFNSKPTFISGLCYCSSATLPGGAIINFISRGHRRDTGGGRGLGSSSQKAVSAPLFPCVPLFLSPLLLSSLFLGGQQHFPMGGFSWNSPGEGSFPASSVSNTPRLTSPPASGPQLHPLQCLHWRFSKCFFSWGLSVN